MQAGNRSGGGRRSIVLPALVWTLALVASALTAAPAGADRSDARQSTWIVELSAPALAAYRGDVSGYAATGPPTPGDRLDVTSPAARRYAALLDRGQSAALSAAGAAADSVLYRYHNALNGFAARLTAVEATRLTQVPGVLRVSPDQRLFPTAVAPTEPEDPAGTLKRDGAAFLGLPSGLWDRLGGPDHAGEGMVVGVIDSGIYPEHPSFADEPGPTGNRRYRGPAYPAPAGWQGTCQAGEGFTAGDCNHKLIGARYYVEGFGLDKLHDDEFLSPRDGTGHGSHTASTAAGNYGVTPVIAGHDFDGTEISGIAPRANLAVYKVCWTGKGGEAESPTAAGACMASDTVAAVDDALADGVDVINYSLGSPHAQLFGPVDRAFLVAADAGVFVAAAAGNDGPDPLTIGSPPGSPWVTSVAATSLARSFTTPITVTPPNSGDDLKLTGASLTGALPDTPLVDAATVPAAGKTAAQAELCLPDSLDSAAVTGKAVLCRRGENPRTEKGETVKLAGGTGMILANATASEDLVADAHKVPAAHISQADGQAVKARLPGAEVRFGGSRQTGGEPDVLAAFSSRGPNPLVPDLGKPDLAAPGVQVLAAATPNPAGKDGGETFQIISGTSMATPHTAGAAALLHQLSPDWSPATIKSALMTTANPGVVKNDQQPPGATPVGDTTPANPFDTGSGRIDPTRAADPGLVLNAGLGDYARYLEGQDPTLVPGDLPPLAPVDLNLPSVTLSALAGSGGTTRFLTSVDPDPTSWTATVEGLTGLDVTVEPPTLAVGRGETKPVSLLVRRATAAFDTWAFGAVVLTESGGDGRTVRLPVSVRPVKVAAPLQAEFNAGDGAGQETGSGTLTVRAGHAGDISAAGWGLAPPQTRADLTIGKAADGAPKTKRGPGVATFDFHVSPGAQLLAAELGDVDGGDPATDLDLYLFLDPEGNGFEDDDQVATSAGPDSAEAIAAVVPEPGPYRLSVVGFTTRNPHTTYDLTTWLGYDPSPDDPATPSTVPGLTVSGDRANVASGDEVPFDVRWARLPEPGVYFGVVSFSDLATPDPKSPASRTLVRITRR